MSESNEFNSSDSINSADEELRVSRPLFEKNCLWVATMLASNKLVQLK